MSVMTDIVTFNKYYTGVTHNSNDKILFENNTTQVQLFGDNLSSQYVPFICGFTGTKYNVKNGEKFLLYNLFYNNQEYKGDFNDRSRRRNTDIKLKKLSYDDILYALSTYIVPRYFQNDNFIFQVAKGIIFEFDRFTKEFELLLVLGVKSSDMWDIDRVNPDYSKFALFISNEFVDDEKYKTVFSKVKKEYISQALTFGIDVIYTNDIKKWCFQTSLKQPKFKNIPEMLNHLSSITEKVYGAIETGNYGFTFKTQTNPADFDF